MVYCGKPSQGCGECRSRKIRCDQVKPVCSQCIRANRICPGYRDQLSLLFRDESQEVIRKARAASSSGKQTRGTRRRQHARNDAKEPATGDFSSDGSDRRQLRYSPLVEQPVSTSAKDQATCLFFRNFGWMGASFLARADSRYSHSQTVEAPVSNKAMLASIAAVGMAALAGIKNSPPLRLAARSEYVQALRYTNAALSDPTQATSDATLTSVSLLAIFEVFTSRVPQSIENWTKHVHGATTLLELRGLRQLESDIGLLLFTQLRNKILISCLQRQAHVPPTIAEFSKIVASMRSDAYRHADTLVEILIKLNNLRADINSKVIVDNVEILSAAQAIESELKAWVVSLPQEWAYCTVKVTEGNFVRATGQEGLYPYNSRYHLYTDLYISHAWNHYRAAAILVNEIIVVQLYRLSTESVTLSFSSEFRVRCHGIRAIQQQLAADICYSVPYHLGLGDTEGMQISRSISSVGGFLLLWPLFLAGSVYGSSHPLRKWTIDCYKLIGRTLGIDQALALADMLNGTQEYESLDIVEQSAISGAKVTEVVDVSADLTGI